MNLRHFFPISILLAVIFYACNPIEEEITTESSARLAYSQDTVIFDTVFSTVGSITKRLRIFNPNKNAIKLNNIFLGKGNSSEYSIIVNGIKGANFRDEIILGNDSLLVLVEVKVIPQDQDMPFIVKDSIVIQSNGNTEHVKLVSWGQDAIFLNGEIIECNTTWTNDRPYVIYNNALVDTLCSLEVEAGARIYLDNNSSLFVKGSLQLNGTLENKVIVRNTRLDEKFDIAPGQWDGIYFLEGSHGNKIDHAIISNGKNGLRIGTPDENTDFDLEIGNTIIEHMSNSGILAFNSDVMAYNTVVYNCDQYVIGNFFGGNYEYRHCTFVNDPSSFFREQESFQFSDNIIDNDNNVLSNELNLKIVNSILWGNEFREIVLSLSGEQNVTLEIHDNIIKTTDDTYEEWGNTISRVNNFPGFYDRFIFDYQIDSLGNARDKGQNIGIDFDILGNPRDIMPDYGAYERLDSIQ